MFACYCYHTGLFYVKTTLAKNVTIFANSVEFKLCLITAYHYIFRSVKNVPSHIIRNIAATVASHFFLHASLFFCRTERVSCQRYFRGGGGGWFRVHEHLWTLVFVVPVAWNFWACFLACMDTSSPEYEPLVVFKFNDAPLILDNYFKFWRVSGQTLSEILRISEKD
jgi:hypothetical protein